MFGGVLTWKKKGEEMDFCIRGLVGRGFQLFAMESQENLQLLDLLFI